MSIDAIALLHVSAAKAKKRVEDPDHVTRLGPDACGVSLFQRQMGLEVRPVQTAVLLREALGEALDLHDDPRGILLYPDVAEPAATTYEALVKELEEGSFWIERELLGQSREELDTLDEKQNREGGFIDRLGGLVRKERDGTIVGVDLHQTQPGSEDFARLCALESLKALDLRRVFTLTRGALAQLTKLRSLERLWLDELKIGDEELELLAEIPNLSALSIVKTRVQGAGFAPFATLPAFKEITIGYTPLDDAGLEVIARLPHLEVLKLAPSNVTDVGVSALSKHPKLRTLDASRTRITDAVIPALLAAPALESVSLRATAITEAGLSRLRGRKDLSVSV